MHDYWCTEWFTLAMRFYMKKVEIWYDIGRCWFWWEVWKGVWGMDWMDMDIVHVELLVFGDFKDIRLFGLRDNEIYWWRNVTKFVFLL